MNLSSHAHFIGPIRFSDYNITGKEVPPEEKYRDKLPPEFLKPGPDGYLPVIAYGQSKTANILHALSLQKYLEHQGISSYALHPGGKSDGIDSGIATLINGDRSQDRVGA